MHSLFSSWRAELAHLIHELVEMEMMGGDEAVGLA
jgi:hypothetical protein